MPPVEQVLAENLTLQGKVASLQEKVVGLETQVAWLKKQLFGGGKGESLDRAQLLLARSVATSVRCSLKTSFMAVIRPNPPHGNWESSSRTSRSSTPRPVGSRAPGAIPAAQIEQRLAALKKG